MRRIEGEVNGRVKRHHGGGGGDCGEKVDPVGDIADGERNEKLTERSVQGITGRVRDSTRKDGGYQIAAVPAIIAPSNARGERA